MYYVKCITSNIITYLFYCNLFLSQLYFLLLKIYLINELNYEIEYLSLFRFLHLKTKKRF